MKSQTYSLRATNQIRRIFKKWVQISRLAYNTAVDLIKQDPKIMKFTLRNNVKKILTKDIKDNSVPNTTIEYAVFEAYQANKSAKSSDNLKYRDNHSLSDAISIDGRSIKNGIIYINNLKRELKKIYGKNKITINNELLKNKLNTSISTTSICKIIWTKNNNKYYLSVPSKREHKPTTDEHYDIVSIDPGVSPFLTYYSESEYGFIGRDFYKRVSPLLKTSDKLLANVEKEKKFTKKSRLKRAAARSRLKAQNIVKDMQWKAANHLASKYKYIFLPKIQTKQLVSARNLPSNVARAIYTSSQFSFRHKLITKAYEYKSTVILCNESYTSKTCTNCGNIKNDLGSAKIYKCTNCNLVTHRDYNGARNIMLKNLTLRDSSFINSS